MASSKKAPRRVERIFAFKILYSLCFSPASSVRDLQKIFMRSPDRPEAIKSATEDSFSWVLAHGVWAEQNALDTVIGKYSQNWRVDRMGKVELTLLRLALFELLYQQEAPPKVVINEAIELSKLFGDDKSRSFLNGILDAVSKALETGDLKKLEYSV